MRLFISHSSHDKPAAVQLATALRDLGFETWLDIWEIGAGDSIVKQINDGLARAGGDHPLLTPRRVKRLGQAELEYLIYARIQEQKFHSPRSPLSPFGLWASDTRVCHATAILSPLVLAPECS